MPVEIILAACAFCMGVLLDALSGDPHSLPHPVRAIGTLITILEKRLRSVFPGTPAGEFAAGVFLVIITTGLTGAGAYLFLTVPARIAAHFFGEAAGYICRYLAESLSVFYFDICRIVPLKNRNFRTGTRIPPGQTCCPAGTQRSHPVFP